ncbi:MAG: hypothetical protein EXS01_04425 [Phycisphaerales bacterium]|nr:hypothetical protein [Phycisphaerales bacterium]
MRLSHKNANPSVRGTTVRRTLSVAVLACIALATVGGTVSSASGNPARGRVRNVASQRYPVAFRAFMDVHYGRMWAHTVQEEVVQRIYARWLDTAFKL